MMKRQIVRYFFVALTSVLVLNVPGFSGYPLTTNGFLRINYLTSGESDGFLVSQMRLGFKGEVSPRNFLVSSLEITNGDSVNNLLLYDVYVKMDLNWFSLRVGQYKYQFGLEQSTPDEDLELISKAKVVSDLLKPTRDIGIELSRKFSGKFLPQVSVSLVNGEGSNKPDVNRDKTFVARLVFDPGKDIALGFSLYEGSVSSSSVSNKDRLGIELKYEQKPLLFKTEYICGKDNTKNSQGCYALIGYYFLPKLLGLGRYELWDENTEQGGDLLRGMVFGVNYFLTENVWLRLNYENTCKENSNQNAGQLVSQIQVKF